MENKKLTKLIVVLHSSLGIVFSTYVIINLIKGFQDFDDGVYIFESGNVMKQIIKQ